MKLPIYIEAAMGVLLVVILAMAGRNGMIPQNQKNNVMKQSEVEQKSDSDMQNEKEAVAEEATDSIEEVTQTDSAAITAQMCSPAGQYPVMGESVVTVDELADYFNQSGYEYPSEELAKGVYRATGIAIEVIPGKKEGDPVLLYTENVAMLKLMRDKFGLKENTLERKLPEDIIVYPKKFQLGVVDAFLEGDPFHPYKVEPTYKKHGRKLSTQFAILARVAGLEGRVAFREGNHPAQYPRCGYIINWKALPFYYDITDEWRQIVKVAPISNRTFLEQNEHMYEISTESHSLLINNIWTYN